MHPPLSKHIRRKEMAGTIKKSVANNIEVVNADLATAIKNPVIAVATGNKMAGGLVTCTASTTIATGLTSIVGAVVTNNSASPSLKDTCRQRWTASGATLTVYRDKQSVAAASTYVASNVQGTVGYLVWGT